MAERPESKRREAKPAQTGSGTVAGPQRKSGTLAPGLWLVATPIGNSADVSLRALDVLRNADVLACEDTRRTRKLMDIHGIALNGRRMISYNDQNGAGRRPQIVAMLTEGQSVAYASDAGTPLVADPGYRLVEAANAEGLKVHVVPGASAVLAALSVAGLPTDRFMFMGFLPVKSTARKREFAEVANLRSTLVLFESPKRLSALLGDAASSLGEARTAAVVREITKKFEEVHRGTLSELAEFYRDHPPKGEIVVVIEPPDRSALQDELSMEEIDALIRAALETQSTKDAAKAVALQTGLAKRTIYQRTVEIAGALNEP